MDNKPKKRVNFEFKTDWKSLTENRRVWFQNRQNPKSGGGVNVTFDGVPFIMLGEKEMWCHQGPDRNKATKRRRKERVNKENVSTRESLEKTLSRSLTISLSDYYF